MFNLWFKRCFRSISRLKNKRKCKRIFDNNTNPAQAEENNQAQDEYKG